MINWINEYLALILPLLKTHVGLWKMASRLQGGGEFIVLEVEAPFWWHGHAYVTYVLCYKFFLEYSCFLPLFFYQRTVTRNTLWPLVAYLAVILSKEVQKTGDYYEMLWMNAQDDAHSLKNKFMLSHKHMGCFVWVFDFKKWVTKSCVQVNEFGMDHF